jgi:hypothetical protein
LCNYEQSHIFGLKLLSFLQCDLDLLLLIEAQYSINKVLLNLQKSNRPNPISLNQNQELSESQTAANTSESENFEVEEEDQIEYESKPDYLFAFFLLLV